METHGDQRGPLPYDDERDDRATVEPEVARTARAIHLRTLGNEITFPPHGAGDHRPGVSPPYAIDSLVLKLLKALSRIHRFQDRTLKDSC